MATSVRVAPSFTPYQHPNAPIFHHSSEALLRSSASFNLAENTSPRPSSSYSARFTEAIRSLTPNVNGNTIDNGARLMTRPSLPGRLVSESPKPEGDDPDHLIGAVGRRDKSAQKPDSIELCELQDTRLVPSPARNRAKLSLNIRRANSLWAPKTDLIRRPYQGSQDPDIITEIREVSSRDSINSAWQESSTTASHRPRGSVQWFTETEWAQKPEDADAFNYFQTNRETRIEIASDVISESEPQQRRRSSIRERISGLLGLRTRAKSDPTRSSSIKGKGIIRTVTREQTITQAEPVSERPDLWQQASFEGAAIESDSPTKGRLRKLSLSWFPGVRNKSV